MKFNKGILLSVLMLCTALISLLSGCAFSKVMDANLNPKDSSLTWDLEVEASVFHKAFNVGEYLDDETIIPTSFGFTINPPVSTIWPLPAGTSVNINVPGAAVITTGFDLNDDSVNDFTVHGVRDPNATLSIILELRDGGVPTSFSSANDISITGMTIESVSYSFDPPVLDGSGRIVLTPSNFPHPSYDYYINFRDTAPYDEINFDIDLTLNGAAGGAAGNYSIELTAQFLLDANFAAAGEFSAGDFDFDTGADFENLPIPSSLGPVTSLNDVDFVFNFDSSFAVDVEIGLDLSADPMPPANNPVTIAHGNYQSITPQPTDYNNYYYVTSSKESTETISIKNDLMGYDSLTMDVTFGVRPVAGRIYLLSTNDEIDIELKITGTGTMSF